MQNTYLFTRQKIALYFLSLGLCLCMSSPYVYADFSERQDVLTWLNQQQDLGFDKAQVKTLLSMAKLDDRVIPDLDDAPERKLVWVDYRDRLVSKYRIKAGGCFLREHKTLLQEVENKYGVNKLVLVAILGIETNYGGFVGRYSVLDTLATLAFEHPKRQKLFKRELAAFFKLAHQQGWSQAYMLERIGSAAGAIGRPQFLPSSYINYALDGDKDGKVDLIDNWSDTITSVANYLLKHQWQAGAPVFQQVDAKHLLNNHTKRPKTGGQSIAWWQSQGLQIPQQFIKQDKNSQTKGKGDYRLYKFSTHAEPQSVIAGANFYAITRYNHSLWYARAVAELAEAIELYRGDCTN